MDNISFITLDAVADLPRVTDLCLRAADYVLLETGKSPNADYARGQMTDVPPHLKKSDVSNIGLERPDGTLAGMINCLRGHPEPDDWYLGLLLLDPNTRRQGLGRRAAQHIIDTARADGGRHIRIAVLEDNATGRAFWAAMGFTFERHVPAENTSHGKACNVLKQDLGGPQNAA